MDDSDDSEWSWNNLNTLCWAIGSISGAMDEMQEKMRADLEKLVQDKEAEINEMVTVLDTLKAEIGKSEISKDSL